jgi:hypothetical protein
MLDIYLNVHFDIIHLQSNWCKLKVSDETDYQQELNLYDNHN